MKKVEHVSLEAVRERERESYTLLNENSFDNIWNKKDSNKSLK